ncbi:primosomal protein N' [Acetivibrio cellulolyticus]|uniref:primosomal protein N' n=1 Tax=Acetivibrio cellulolyticus TaxID=35830 RepID=UPI0002481C7C
MNNIAEIVISNSTRQFDRVYHYMIPDNYISNVTPGIRVIVPFGKSNRLREGYVVGVLSESDMQDLKEISEVIDKSSVVDINMIKLAHWMRHRYISTYSDVFKCLLPPGTGMVSCKTVRLLKFDNALKGNYNKILQKLMDFGGELEYDDLSSETNIKGISKYLSKLEELGCVAVSEEFGSKVSEKLVKVAYLIKPIEEVLEDIEGNRLRSIKQVRILEMLLENEHISVTDLARFAGVSKSVLDTLNKYGYIGFKDIEVTRDPYNNRTFERTSPLRPTEEQEHILVKVKEMLDSKAFNEVLLHGITGSGKTEVYLQLIDHAINAGKQAIVLVPEISLTPQMVERFKGRFGEYVAVLHSRLSLGERYDQWRLIKSGNIKVAVGARSAVFAPFDNLGIIIIDEEHENSYKSEISPKYHAVEVARERCKNENAILMYGSATPSIENYYRAVSSEISLFTMVKRANNLTLPKVEVVDMRCELDEGNRSIFSRALSCEMRENIKRKEQTIIFLNRRGYASFVLCRNCGYVLKCPKCDVSMTYHSYDERLICHYCGYTIKNVSSCPKCKSPHIRGFGTGTQKIEDEIRKHFEESTVLRMDMDTTTYKNSHEDILRNFREKNINILVGTQMIAKGHDFPNVTLVGVLAADSILNTGDFRATERTFQLITQVAGRAGRGKIPGRVIIQTYNAENYSIECACSQDYVGFFEKELMVREKLIYPPFTNIGSIVLSGVNDRLVYNKAVEVKKFVDSYFADEGNNFSILGPSRSLITKIKNKYRWRIVIKYKEMEKLIDILTQVSDSFYQKQGKNDISISVDINPISML